MQYADDIFYVISNLAENLTNLAEILNIVGPCWIHEACFFQLHGPLALGGLGRHQVPSGVVVRIVKGKSRAKALLNTGLDPLIFG